MGIRKEEMIWVIILGLILRLININQSLWLDEAISTLAVKNYSLFDLVAQYARADFHPPGWFVILWLWAKLFGYSEIAVRIPSVIFGVLTISIVYLIGKKLVSKQLGITAALLLAINPLHIYYSQEARMYAMAALAVSVNMLLLLKLIKGEKLNLIFLILSNIFVLISDYIAYFIFPAQLIFLLFHKKELLKKWLLSLSIATVSFIWWLPIFINQLDVGAVASAKLPTWKFVVGGFDFKALPLTFVKFIIGRINLANKIIYAILLLPVSIMFFFLLYKGVKNATDFSRKVFLYWILLPLVIATAVSLFVPVYSYFRVLFVLPAFIILISLGISSFKKKIQYIALITVFSIQFFCTLTYLFNPTFHREDWRGLVDFLKTNKSPVILFESSGTLPPFDYYANNQLNAMGALKDFPAVNVDDVLDLSKFKIQSKELYLIEYLIHISDPQRFVERKLDDLSYKRIKTIDFRGVGFVHHYVKE